MSIATERVQQPDCTFHSSEREIGTAQDVLSNRSISDGDMKVALHELSHENTLLTDVTMNVFSVRI